MLTHPSKPHDPVTPVAAIEELRELLVAGLASGAPRPMTDDDWVALRQRAVTDPDRR